MAVQMTPIATLHTCYKEKFGIPRQPNLVKEATGRLIFSPEFASPEAVRELEGFSHIWLVFLFHQSIKKKDTETAWSPMVRPPRLGGNKKVGVFASRSPFRPNPIGLSAVCLESVEQSCLGPILHLSGVDILDQTPILDIKPYLPYSDVITHARDGFANGPPKPGLTVKFSTRAMADIQSADIPNLAPMIKGILENDPRPAYSKGDKPDRIFGIQLFDFDVKWQVTQDRVRVLCLENRTK